MEKLNLAELAEEMHELVQSGLSLKLELSELIRAVEGGMTALQIREMAKCSFCEDCADCKLAEELEDELNRRVLQPYTTGDDFSYHVGNRMIQELRNLLFNCEDRHAMDQSWLEERFYNFSGRDLADKFMKVLTEEFRREATDDDLLYLAEELEAAEKAWEIFEECEGEDCEFSGCACADGISEEVMSSLTSKIDSDDFWADWNFSKLAEEVRGYVSL